MIGIIVQLLISWGLIWLFEKRNLGVLGFYPTRRRLIDFGLFFIITAACASSGFFMRMYFGERWELNPAFTWKLLADGLWYNVKSVLFEELIFRGVILYIMIRRIGAVKAIIVSAVAFGIYHWFSYGVFGNPGAMTVIFIATGLAGLLYAYGYAKTFSLYIPCAIHLGWNFTSNFVFSDGNIGNGILIHTKPAYTVTVSWLVYFFVAYFSMILMLIVNYLLIKRKRQAEKRKETEKEKKEEKQKG